MKIELFGTALIEKAAEAMVRGPPTGNRNRTPSHATNYYKGALHMAPRDQQIKEIREIQDQSASAKEICAAISKKLSEIEGVKSEAHLAAAELPKLNARKQAFQADIALGGAIKQSDIDQLDENIAKITAGIEYHHQTVLGLTSKLTAAQNDVDHLNDKAVVLLRAFLESEAEALNITYMEQANILLATFRRLIALDRLSKSIGGNPFHNGAAHTDFTIPTFYFVASGQWPGYAGRWIPAEEMSRPELYAAADEAAEKARLLNLKIQI